MKEYPLFDTWHKFCPTARYVGGTSGYLCECAEPQNCPGAMAAQGKPEPYTQLYDGLRVTVLTQEQHERTCNYWYTVTTHNTPHVAFRTKEGLLRWMNERGLRLTKALTEPGEWSTQEIEGSYVTASHLSEAVFYTLNPDSIIGLGRTLSNGRVTLAIFTYAAGEPITVHTLNPNVRTRPEFKHYHD